MWKVSVLRARSFWAGFHVEISGRLLSQDSPAWDGQGMSVIDCLIRVCHGIHLWQCVA